MSLRQNVVEDFRFKSIVALWLHFTASAHRFFARESELASIESTSILRPAMRNEALPKSTRGTTNYCETPKNDWQKKQHGEQTGKNKKALQGWQGQSLSRNRVDNPRLVRSPRRRHPVSGWFRREGERREKELTSLRSLLEAISSMQQPVFDDALLVRLVADDRAPSRNDSLALDTLCFRIRFWSSIILLLFLWMIGWYLTWRLLIYKKKVNKSEIQVKFATPSRSTQRVVYRVSGQIRHFCCRAEKFHLGGISSHAPSQQHRVWSCNFSKKRSVSDLSMGGPSEPYSAASTTVEQTLCKIRAEANHTSCNRLVELEVHVPPNFTLKT